MITDETLRLLIVMRAKTRIDTDTLSSVTQSSVDKGKGFLWVPRRNFISRTA